MRTGLNSRSGFTLIELTVVLIVIGIFSGLMFAEMRGTYEDALLRSMARRIISAAELVSSRAVTLGHPQSLAIDSQPNRLRVQSDASNSQPEEEQLDSRVRLEIRELPNASDDDADPGADTRHMRQDLRTIQFFPDGTASGREIVLRDRMGVQLVLRLSPVTGRIQILQSEETR